MYTIKQAAARTGCRSRPSARGSGATASSSPARTAAGYRLYDEDAIERLGAMRYLVETEGWRPSQAADRVKDPAIDLAALADRRR